MRIQNEIRNPKEGAFIASSSPEKYIYIYRKPNPLVRAFLQDQQRNREKQSILSSENGSKRGRYGQKQKVAMNPCILVRVGATQKGQNQHALEASPSPRVIHRATARSARVSSAGKGSESSRWNWGLKPNKSVSSARMLCLTCFLPFLARTEFKGMGSCFMGAQERTPVDSTERLGSECCYCN